MLDCCWTNLRGCDVDVESVSPAAERAGAGGKEAGASTPARVFPWQGRSGAAVHDLMGSWEMRATSTERRCATKRQTDEAESGFTPDWENSSRRILNYLVGM